MERLHKGHSENKDILMNYVWTRAIKVWRGDYKTKRIQNSNCDKIDTQSDFVSISIFTEVSCITL